MRRYHDQAVLVRVARRIAAVVLLATLTAAVALPRSAGAVDSQFEKMRARVAAFIAEKMEKLGGSQIVYRVDSDGLRESVVTELRDEVYKTLRENKIAFSGLAVRDDGVEVKVADARAREQLARKLASAAEGSPSRAAAATEGGDGLIRFAPTEAASAARLRELVDDSIGMIEQRVKDVGINLAGAQPDGPDRIRILVPGMMEPERVTALFARKVRVSFRLIDLSMPAEQAQAGPPPGSEVMFGFKDKRPYLVAKDNALDGNDISEAAPSLETGSRDPIVSFRFNGRGTRRFAHITAENVGRPFAIVLDDKVISAPMIREPITGGSVQISGNFTAEEAMSVAMLLRASALPGRLTLVDQQVVQPPAKP
jgi:preprotein translocase subunit SecD